MEGSHFSLFLDNQAVSVLILRLQNPTLLSEGLESHREQIAYIGGKPAFHPTRTLGIDAPASDKRPQFFQSDQ